MSSIKVTNVIYETGGKEEMSMKVLIEANYAIGDVAFCDGCDMVNDYGTCYGTDQ